MVAKREAKFQRKIVNKRKRHWVEMPFQLLCLWVKLCCYCMGHVTCKEIDPLKMTSSGVTHMQKHSAPIIQLWTVYNMTKQIRKFISIFIIYESTLCRLVVTIRTCGIPLLTGHPDFTAIRPWGWRDFWSHIYLRDYYYHWYL